jgi:hypothetical protein
MKKKYYLDIFDETSEIRVYVFSENSTKYNSLMKSKVF